MISAEGKGEASNPRSGQTMAPRFLGGALADVQGNEDRRKAFAAWLTSAKNPYFAKSVVNRVWYHLMGRGIVEPVDDFRASNPASHPELLEHLTNEFAADFDLRKLIQTIMRSRVYQLSVKPREGAVDEKYFSAAMPRMLTAEQAYEAMCEVTEVRDKLPGGADVKRIAAVADTEAVETKAKAFLKSFNQPARELTCECERTSEGNLAQALQMLNGPALQERLSKSENRIGRLLSAKTNDEAILSELYLAALARQPRDDEKKTALDYVAKSNERRRAWEDIFWAVMTSREFILQH